MIHERQAHKYCRDDISKIENYDKAISDTTQTWDLHHRLELTLYGEYAHNVEELKRMGMYYNRPYFELIFMTHSEHLRMHKKVRYVSEETRKRMSQAFKGRVFSEDTRKKLAESHRVVNISEETRKRMSEAAKRKSFSEEHRRKLSEAAKRQWARQRSDENLTV